MRRFWYFDVLKWSGEKKWCISVLRLNELIITPLYNSSNSGTPDNHLECLNMYGFIYYAWCCLRMSWGCLRKSLVVSGRYFGDAKAAWESFGFSPYRVESCWRQPTNLVQHWNVKKIFTWSFWDIKIPKPQHEKLSKNHWVRHFFAFFRFVREILFVTVTFDHPVGSTSLVNLGRGPKQKNGKILTELSFFTVFNHKNDLEKVWKSRNKF